MKSPQKRFNFKTFAESFDIYRKQAFEFLCEIETVATSDQADLEQAEEGLEWNLGIMRLRLLFALETFGYHSFIATFNKGFKPFEGKLKELTYVQYADTYHSPAFGYLVDFYNIFSLLSPVHKDESGRTNREKLYGFLQGTPKMIFERKEEPNNEAGVKNIVRQYLSYSYPDLASEIPIPGTIKTYKPDFGIRSLKTAIEYKFVDSRQELNVCLGGIFEDVHGYAGSSDWKHFFAVIYMTQPFITFAELKAEEERANLPSNWKLILVSGNGKRTPKKQKRQPEQ